MFPAATGSGKAVHPLISWHEYPIWHKPQFINKFVYFFKKTCFIFQPVLIKKVAIRKC
jgi:hypothetical protein